MFGQTVLDQFYFVYKEEGLSIVMMCNNALITFLVSHRRCKMYCGHPHLCVCLCVCPGPHAYTIAWTRM